MSTIRATGSTLTNTVDINANNINVFNNGLKQYQNINEIFVNNSQIIEASKNTNNVYEYPSEDITDENISGLKSMLDYINSHSKKNVNYYYEDNNNIMYKKKINKSKKTLNLEDNNIYNKITNTITHIIRNWNYEDNNSMYIRKHINRSKKYFTYDDNTTYNKVNKITKNNTYKNYNISNINENFSHSKNIINNNITRKTIPNYIHEDNYYYFNKTVNGSSSNVDLTNYYNKAYIDEWISSFQNTMSYFDQRLTAVQQTLNPGPGSEY